MNMYNVWYCDMYWMSTLKNEEHTRHTQHGHWVSAGYPRWRTNNANNTTTCSAHPMSAVVLWYTIDPSWRDARGTSCVSTNCETEIEAVLVQSTKSNSKATACCLHVVQRLEAFLNVLNGLLVLTSTSYRCIKPGPCLHVTPLRVLPNLVSVTVLVVWLC